MDAYSKYFCVHPVSSVSSATTIDCLNDDFAHFGYPLALVSDNATSFSSEMFQEYCSQRHILHLSGAPYHPATNGIAERAIQTFKKSMKKLIVNNTVKQALHEFLIMYRRTPLDSGYSPAELLNGRRIRTMVDVLLPSPQLAQLQVASRSHGSEQPNPFKKGQRCYAQVCDGIAKNPTWIAATVTDVFGPRSVVVKVDSSGQVWHRHLEQLQLNNSSSAEPSVTNPVGPRRSNRLRKKAQ